MNGFYSVHELERRVLRRYGFFNAAHRYVEEKEIWRYAHDDGSWVVELTNPFRHDFHWTLEGIASADALQKYGFSDRTSKGSATARGADIRSLRDALRRVARIETETERQGCLPLG